MNEQPAKIIVGDNQSYALNREANGVIKIWQFNPVTGEKKLCRHQNNTILYSGADLLATALAGKANSGISHIYVGFNNNVSFVVGDEPAVTRGGAQFKSTGDYGYIRVPLTFPASYNTQANYSNNSVFFTVMLTSPPASVGATFGNTSKIFTIGLCAAMNPEGSDQDKIFSRAQFTPITYDPTFGLTITWGVKFTAN